MLEKIQRGHKVKAEDIKMVLASVVHKGKVTVWNQLFMLVKAHTHHSLAP